MKLDVRGRTRCAGLMAGFLMTLVPLVRLGAEDSPPSSTGVAAVLQPFVDQHHLAGAVTLIADRDRVLSLEAVGYSDVAAKTPMKTDAIFWIASQSKSITGAAFMVLVDEGKVSLDDPVEKYLPEFKGQQVEGDKDHPAHQPKHPITVREVLSHTSGLPFSTGLEHPTLDKFTLAERVKDYAKTPLKSEPGTKYSYSNAGINTAGRIIEVVSGMPYETFLDKKIIEPLGMKDTTYWPNKEQIARLAKGHKPNKAKTDLEETRIGQLAYPLDSRDRQPMPAGGLFSTASDVAVFCQMVLNGGTWHGKKILSPEAVKLMTSKQTGELKDGYGLGWSVNGPHTGHGGAMATNMSIDTKRGLITVYMVQNVNFPKEWGNAHGAFQHEAEKMFDRLRK